MTITAALSLITLGVRDVAASTAFYEALGWTRSSASVEGDVSFFKNAGSILAVWGQDDLAADVGSPVDAPGFRGVSVAINLQSPEAVDAALADAEKAGATIVKAGTTTEWGGYSAYFADPDRHIWEVAHNPFWPLGADGLPQLPD